MVASHKEETTYVHDTHQPILAGSRLAQAATGQVDCAQVSGDNALV
jgi:hypothetical protein